ncbi:tellurite resistance TerB family protein [bacterium]|nr:tellurite resistance TerB family protein [bacterium]
MGLFDNMFGGNEAAKGLTKHEAFAGILLAASAVDGHIASEEISTLINTISRMKLYSNFNDDKYGRMFDRLMKMLKKHGAIELTERCAPEVPDDLRETVFANACDIVLADGVVEDEERELIEKLQNELEIPGDEAMDIVRIMVIKNRG